MNLLKKINLVLLTLLAFASGASKIMQIPQEMEFFQGVMGFSANSIVVFGVVQFAAGALLIFRKTRILGAIILGVSLLVSTILIFMAGKLSFGMFSIVPIVMAGFVILGSTGTQVLYDAPEK